MTKLDINTITKVQYGKLSLEEDYIIMIECEECGKTPLLDLGTTVA